MVVEADINLREETQISVAPDSVARFIGHLVCDPIFFTTHEIKKLGGQPGATLVVVRWDDGVFIDSAT